MFQLIFLDEIHKRHGYGHIKAINGFKFLIFAVRSHLGAKNDHFTKLSIALLWEWLGKNWMWKFIGNKHSNKGKIEEPAVFNGKSTFWARNDQGFFWYTKTILLFYFFALEMSDITKNDGRLSDNMTESIISTKEPDVSKKWSISTYRGYVKKENIMK